MLVVRGRLLKRQRTADGRSTGADPAALPLRSAGEGLVLRDDRGTYFVIPADILPHARLSDPTAESVQADLKNADNRSHPFSTDALGPCEILGATDAGLIVRDGDGNIYAVPPELLSGARVPPTAHAMLEQQLPAAPEAFAFDSSGFGALSFLGALSISYEPDPQDSAEVATSSNEGRLPSEAGVGDALAQASQTFWENGWCQVPGVAFNHRLVTLVGEGESLARSASHQYEIASEENLVTRMKRYATSGAVLKAVHQDPAILSALRYVSGTLLVPTRCAYFFYRGDDYITLHVDASHCPVAVLVRVVGDPPPLMICPDLRGCGPERLRAVIQGSEGHPANGTPMVFPDDGAIVFQGCEMPHHRPPQTTDRGFVGVAQLCYRSVWRRSRPPQRMVAKRALAESSPGLTPGRGA